MDIPVTDEYRISSDQHSWMIEKPRSRIRNGKPIKVWEPIRWYPTLEMTVNGLGELMVMALDAQTFTDALVEIENVSATLCQALHPHYEVKPRGNQGERSLPSD